MPPAESLRALAQRLPRTLTLLLAWVTILDMAGALATPLHAGLLLAMGILFAFHPNREAAPSFMLVATGCMILTATFHVAAGAAWEAAVAAGITLFFGTLEPRAPNPARRT